MPKKETALLVIPFLLATLHLFGQSSTITLGKAEGWNRLETVQNVAMTEGRQGYLDLTVRSAEYVPDAETDALFHFDQLPVRDATGRFKVTSSDVLTATNSPRLGPGAAVFTGDGSGISVAIPPDGFLAPGKAMGDFSIEFWLYPVSADNSSTILLWKGARLQGGKAISQEFRVDFHDRHLRLTFQNLFVPPNGQPYQLVLEGRRGLVPRTWHHHLIRFDAADGLIEYLVDSTPEAVAYVTSTAAEGGSVYLPMSGMSSIPELEIGPSYVGMMDELRIEKSVVTDPHLDPVSDARGIVQTGILDLGYTHSKVQRIDAETETPGQTAVIFLYRIGNSRKADDVANADWVPFQPGTDFTAGASGAPPTGRYLQVRAELLPDGPRLVAPRLHSLSVTYLPDLPPMPPAVVSAQAGNAQVTLKWSAVPELDVKGYLVYYGDRPSQYFGTDAAGGASPIDVGNVTQVTLNGLTNGKLYYFSVAAYDESHTQRSSAFSKEVSARPLRIY